MWFWSHRNALSLSQVQRQILQAKPEKNYPYVGGERTSQSGRIWNVLKNPNFLWFRQQVKMAKGGLRVPDPVVLRKHVLVMSFIGCFLVKDLIYRHYVEHVGNVWQDFTYIYYYINGFQVQRESLLPSWKKLLRGCLKSKWKMLTIRFLWASLMSIFCALSDSVDKAMFYTLRPHPPNLPIIMCDLKLCQVVEMMVQLYQVCHLVHADLSE